MNTSTPMRKWKTTCCGNFTNISNSLLEDNCEDTLHGNDSILRQDHAELTNEEIGIEVFTQKFDNNCASKSQELFPFSPITHPKQVPRSLIPLLDSPLKFSSPLLTPYCIPSENVSSYQHSDDTFVRTVFHIDSGKMQTHCSTSDTASIPKNFEHFQYSNSDDASDIVNENKSLEILGSPVVASKEKKKKNRCKVNKNLFSLPKSQCQNTDDILPVVIDSYEISNETVNAIEHVCKVTENSMGSSTIESTLNRCNRAYQNEFNFSFSTSFDMCENRTIEAIFDDGNKKHFVYPFENVQKPTHSVLVDDILDAVLPLEQTAQTKIPAKTQKFRPGLISFNELSMLPDYGDEWDYTLPSSSRNEFNVSMCLRSSAHENNEAISKTSFRYRFCSVILDNREIYRNLKKYFEYYRVDFAREALKTNPTKVYEEITNAFDGSKSYQLTYLTDRVVNNLLSEKWRELNASFLLVADFFHFFRANLHLVYNFNLLGSSRQLFFLTRLGNVRKVRRKRQRDTSRLEFEKNLVLGMLPCRDEEVTQQVSVYDLNHSPLRKIFRSSYEFEDSILEQFDDNFTIDYSPPNKQYFGANAKSLYDKLEEDLDISDTQLTNLCESVEKSNGCNQRFGVSGGSSIGYSQSSTLLNETTSINSTAVCGKSSFDNAIENSPSNFQRLNTSYHSTAGFRTANGKTLVVDEKLLMRGRKLHERLDDISKMENIPIEKVVGFNTASGIQISINEKSLLAAKKLFDDLEMSEELSTAKKPTEDDLVAGTGKQYYVGEGSFSAKSSSESWPVCIDSPVGLDDNKQLPVQSKNVLHQISHNPTTNPKNFSSSTISVKSAGFSTASGKSVNIGGESMIAARKLFESVSNDIETVKALGINICEFGSNELSNVFGDSSIIRGKRAFDDVLYDAKPNGRQFKNPKSNVTSCSSKLPGSNTAVRKPGRTDTTLSRTEKLLDNPAGSQVDVKDVEFFGFSIANGKRIDVSETALATANKILENVDVGVEMNVKQATDSEMSRKQKSLFLENCLMKEVSNNMQVGKKNLNTNKHNKNQRSLGFSTAAGNLIKVKEESLTRAKKLLVDVQDTVDTKDHIELQYFNTVNEKRVNVDEKSLAHANKLFDSVSKETETNLVADDVNVMDQEDDWKLNLACFSTARGKQITVNEKSLAVAKTFFDTVVKETQDNTEHLSTKNMADEESSFAPKLAEFCSVREKRINADERSASEVKKLFDCVSKETEETITNKESYPGSKFAGFSTASGKQVAVNETALHKAKKLFDSVSNESEVTIAHKETYYGQKFAGFSTACGKQITVNETALHKAKKLFDSVSNETEETITNKESYPGSKFAGFSTASGKQVAVNEVALHKAKKLFDCVGDETKENKQFFDIDLSYKDIFGRNMIDGKAYAVSEKSLHTVGKSSCICTNDTKINNEQVFNVKAEDKRNCGAAQGKVVVTEKPFTVENFTLQSAENSGLTEFVEKKSLDCVDKETEENTVRFGAAKIANIENHVNQHRAGFSTANGKLVNINTKSLSFAKRLYDTVTKETEDNARLLSVEKIPIEDLNATESSNSCIASEDRTNLEKLQTFDNVKNEAENVSRQALTKKENSVDSNATCKNHSFNTIQKCSREVVDELETNSIKICSLDTIQSSLPFQDVNTTFKTKICLESVTSARRLKDEHTCRREFDQLPRSSLDGVTFDVDVSRNLPVDYITSSKCLNTSTAGEKSSYVKEESTDFLSRKVDDVFNNVDVDQFFADIDSVPDSEKMLDFELIGYLDGSAEKSNKLEGTNITREVTESTSAFLFDMKENTSFVPTNAASPVCLKSGDENETTEPTSEQQRSKGGSPVFDSNKLNRKKKNKKRRSQCSLSMTPLNVTYIRKDNESIVCDKTNPEHAFKMFKNNFAQKCGKRKETASSMAYSASKKSKERGVRNELAEERKRAAINQQNYVREKDRESCKPRRGTYLTRKTNEKRKTLREIVNNERPRQYVVDKLLQFGLKRSVVVVDAENARDFVFTSDFLNSTTGTYGDECQVIPNENNEVIFDDFARAFLASPGVDPRLISIPWIRNHYRWIIWKLASTEKSFPRVFGAVYLTLDNVLLQLKFRYDWEVDRCQRSALKRILECDDSASKTMVLCVATIKPIAASVSEYEVELTDGWYSIICLIDSEMNKLISKKRVTVGTKLMIMNAELIGLSEGCDPLQVPDSVRLRIATNSVRRVLWDTPLGFYCGKSIIIRKLQHVLRNGGVIPQLIVMVSRIYPLMYFEKKEDGTSELYNEKIHFKKIANYEKKRQACLEILVSQITKEVEKENCMFDSDEIKNHFDSDSDPPMYQIQQFREQEKLRALIEDRVKKKLPEEFKERRRASCMLKVRLINEDGDLSTSALLTIWHPNEDLISLLSEGKMYSLRNVVAGGSRSGDLRLSTNRLTTFEVQTTIGKVVDFQRCFIAFDVLKADFTCSFGEVDTVGVVLSVTDSAYEGDKYRNQTVYLVDLEKNIIAVQFRSSVKDFGYEDTLKRKRIIGCLNLQWKCGFLYWKIPIVFANEFTSFVYKSRHQHLQKRIEDFDCYFKNRCMDTFLTECDTKLDDIIASPGPVATSTPLKSCSKKESVQNTSSLVADASSNVSSHSLHTSNNSFDSLNGSRNANSKSAHSRIEKLRGYGEPPPLSPILLCTRPKRARLSIQTRVFKSSNDKT